MKPVISYYDYGNRRSESWLQNNQLHRIDGPAKIKYHNNIKIHESWFQNGKYHRLNGPADIYYHNNGNKRTESWLQNNQLHRIDGPAIIRYYYDGNIKCKIWYLYDRLQREIHYLSNNKKSHEQWYFDKNLHIPNIAISKNINDIILHRPVEQGPAYIDYRLDLKLYYLFGEEIYERRLREIITIYRDYIYSVLNIAFNESALTRIVFDYYFEDIKPFY